MQNLVLAGLGCVKYTACDLQPQQSCEQLLSMSHYVVPACICFYCEQFSSVPACTSITACSAAASASHTAHDDELHMGWLSLAQHPVQAMMFVLVQADTNTVTAEVVHQ